MINKKFVIKLNKKLSHKEHLPELLKFQIDRINYFQLGEYLIFDPDMLLEKNNVETNQPVFSISELQNWCNSLDSDSIIFLIDSVNPFLDIDLIENLEKQFFDLKINGLIVDGAISGTSPDLVCLPNFLINYLSQNNNWPNKIENANFFYWDTQRLHNAQFDLNKTHRIRILSKLISKIPSLHTLKISDFIKKLNDDEIFNFILDWGIDDLQTEEVTDCPYCKSKNLKPLYLSTNQTWIGFVSNQKPLYYECLDCSLVTFRKLCDKSNVYLFYDEYERSDTDAEPLIEGYKKFRGSHFIEKRKSLDIIEPLLPKNASVIDLGAGFGEFACFEKYRNPNWNVKAADFNLTPVKELLNSRGVEINNVNFLEKDFGNDYDLITMWQAIEHVPFYGIKPFFEHVKNSLKNGGYFILATPDYDSPFCKVFDYHLMYPPHHQTILSGTWLTKFVTENNLFKVVRKESANLPWENYDEWFDYYRKTSPNTQTESMVKIFDMIHDNSGLFKSFEENISKQKLGSEVILILQK